MRDLGTKTMLFWGERDDGGKRGREGAGQEDEGQVITAGLAGWRTTRGRKAHWAMGTSRRYWKALCFIDWAG